MNVPTIIVGIIVFAIIGLVFYKLIKDVINHKTSCGCGCEDCPNKGMCHK